MPLLKPGGVLLASTNAATLEPEKFLRMIADGLSAAQTLQWRAIVVEERFNVTLSPWKESNVY